VGFVGWAKAAPTHRLIRGAGSAVPTIGAAVGTADHGPCPAVAPRPPLPTLASKVRAHDHEMLVQSIEHKERQQSFPGNP
jgi:hypothetical protein